MLTLSDRHLAYMWFCCHRRAAMSLFIVWFVLSRRRADLGGALLDVVREKLALGLFGFMLCEPSWLWDCSRRSVA